MGTKTKEPHNCKRDIFKVKTTLTNPSIILKSPRYEKSYIYVKVFDDSKIGIKGGKAR
jgi:hypothetical protein